jgi:signal peptide peptidase SppA
MPRPKISRAKFDRRGHLAIHSASWGNIFDVPEPKWYTAGGIAIVEIRGPLTHHDEWWWDSYDAIKDRVAEAAASACGTIVLKIDSPGGDVFGCFETADAIRELAKASGKRLIAYSDGMAASAAYALACSADEIYVPSTGYVGSIGVITVIADQVALDRAMGINVSVITSGKRKADGNPHVPISDDTVSEIQRQVDSLAQIFFEAVSSSRGLSVERVRALEAGLLHGQAAIEAGLADAVLSFDELLAMVASGDLPRPTRAEEQTPMTYDELVAELRKMAEGDGEEAEKAKKLLAAMEEEEKDDGADGADGSAASEPGDGGDGGDDEQPDAAASAQPAVRPARAQHGNVKAAVEVDTAIVETTRDLAATVQQLASDVVALKKERLAAAREKLFASRPDVSPKVKAALKSAPLSLVKATLDAIEIKPRKDLAAAAKVAPTQGETQGQGRSSRLPPEQKQELDEQMGLAAPKGGIRHERNGHSLVLGVMTREQAAAYLASKKASTSNPTKGA